MSAVTVTKSRLPWLLSLSLTIMFARSPEALGYPQSLPSCERLQRSAFNALRPQLSREYEAFKRALSSLTLSAWVPRAPQLRGRVDRDDRADSSPEWSHRVGARLYIPSIGADPSEVRRLGVSFSELPDVWREARLREESARVATLHITARKSWVELRAAQERVAITEGRYEISTALERSGALSRRDLKRAQLQRELAILEEREALARWVELSSMIRAALSQGSDQRRDQDERRSNSAPREGVVTPLESICAPRITSSQEHTRLQRPRALSSQEASLLFKLNQDSVNAVRDERRWFDFVEVSYDQRGDDTRWIAEVGVDLVPLETRDVSKRLRLDQLRAELRDRMSASARAESKLRASLELLRARPVGSLPPSTLERPELTQLPDLEIYELEVKLWSSGWRHALSAERTLIEWRAMQSAD